jgi:hypothetical protein
VVERLGTDPVFAQVVAFYGAQMREDRPPTNAAPSVQPGDVQTLMASEAYRNPKHVDHARVSAQVQAAYKRMHGDNPV